MAFYSSTRCLRWFGSSCSESSDASSACAVSWASLIVGMWLWAAQSMFVSGSRLYTIVVVRSDAMFTCSPTELDA